ncbi:MAG: FlgD immunoglobulin-like domain containing protein [Candidatus Zhuqueibacterota bacterium]
MKSFIKILSTSSCVILVSLLFSGVVSAQFVINANDFPSTPGICIITEDDTVNGIGIDVGLPGANRVWRFDQPYPSTLSRQVLMAPKDTPFSAQFPDANVAVRYDGKLGHIVHSYYFDDISGEIYGYQQLTPGELRIQGFGVDSALARYNEYVADVRGIVDIEPNVLMHSFPLRYGKTWQSVSDFSVEADTTLFGIPITLSADIKDNVSSVVDGWGTIYLPNASYRTLRVKSYISLQEDLFLNGVQIRSKKTRTINYYWIAQHYGIVARVISYSNEPDDGFLLAKQVSRIHLFNPKIELRLDSYSGHRGDIFEIPIHINKVTDLSISSVQFKIGFDTGKLIPMEVITRGALTEKWRAPELIATTTGVQFKLSGDEPLAGEGVLCYLKMQANPNATDYGLTAISFDEVKIDKSGPMIVPFPGRFVLLPGNVLTREEQIAFEQLVAGSLAEFRLMQNYPNPFNSLTTIGYQLPSNSTVTLQIFDMQGRLIHTLAQGTQPAGQHFLNWDGRDGFANLVASGTYYYRIDVAPNETTQQTLSFVKKLILLK